MDMPIAMNLLNPAVLFSTTLRYVHFVILLLFMIVTADMVNAAVAVPGNIPLFRHLDPAAKLPAALPAGKIRLLTENNFPPFSFSLPDGGTAGLSTDLAKSACAELKLDCEIIVKPFDQLLPALLNKEGDVIVSGLKLNEAILKNAVMTRPYFWSLGRFAVPTGSQLRKTDIRNLAGKRLGFVENSAHGAWLKKYYSRSTLTAFANENEMYEALRKNSVDAIFGDNLHILYWLAGSTSHGCCKTLDGAYVDHNYFSANLSFLTRSDSQDLARAMDYALDRLQEKGISSQVFARYLPDQLW